MKDKKIEEYDFTDCLLIDFDVDKLLSTLFIIVEAYYPLLSDGTRKRGLLKVVFSEIRSLSLSKEEEFDFDINLAYDENGNDTKANEIYSLGIFRIEEELYKCAFESDMLNFQMQCKTVKLDELNLGGSKREYLKG